VYVFSKLPKTLWTFRRLFEVRARTLGRWSFSMGCLSRALRYGCKLEHGKDRSLDLITCSASETLAQTFSAQAFPPPYFPAVSSKCVVTSSLYSIGASSSKGMCAVVLTTSNVTASSGITFPFPYSRQQNAQHNYRPRCLNLHPSPCSSPRVSKTAQRALPSDSRVSRAAPDRAAQK
jgi:hypothetical protein